MTPEDRKMISEERVRIQEEPQYVDFCIPDIQELQNDYLATIDFLLDELPDVNWNSRIEVKDFFGDCGIDLKDLQIRTVQSELISAISYEQKDLAEILGAYLSYLKTKYEVKNYTSCILKHNIDGRLYLRKHNNEWVMPNKQPLPYSQNILECVLDTNSPNMKDKISQLAKGN